jgi:TrpR family trp operon transcriptional repressor
MHGIREIAELLARVEDPRLIAAFLKSLLTRRELEEVDGRWELVKRLARGESQRAIARRLGMSLCKITRGSRELKKRNSAFRRVLSEYL